MFVFSVPSLQAPDERRTGEVEEAIGLGSRKCHLHLRVDHTNTPHQLRRSGRLAARVRLRRIATLNEVGLAYPALWMQGHVHRDCQ